MTDCMKLTGFIIVALMFFVAQPANAWWDEDYLNCVNITIEEINGITRTNMPIIFNLSGMIDKQPDSSDFRFTNAGCNGTGALIDFEILSNTSTSVYFASLVNLTKNANNTFSGYWNNSIAETSDNPSLFEYANNGTTAWKSDAGTSPIKYVPSNSSIQSGLHTVANSYNYSTLPVNYSTGNFWFSHKINIIDKDSNGVGLGLGDDFLGSAKASYQGWIVNIMAYANNYVCYDTDFRNLIVGFNVSQWYNINVNFSFATARSNATSDDGVSWIGCGYNPAGWTPNSIDQLRFIGSDGAMQVKDIFLSQTPFNSYLYPVYIIRGTTEGAAPPIIPNATIEFISPTPDNGSSHGMDYTPVITVAFYNNTPVGSIKIEINGVNYSAVISGATASYGPAVDGGTTYRYRGIITTATITNTTELRTLFIISDTESNINNRFDLSKLTWLLLFIMIGFLAWFILR